MSNILIQKDKNKIRDWKRYSSELLAVDQKKFFKKEEERLKFYFNQNYFQINDSQIKKDKSLIDQFLKENKVNLIVPMKEREDTIKNLLSYAEKRLPEDSIIVVNDESSQKAVKTVLRYKNVIMINKNEILDLIYWKNLLPILNLNQKPKGKGVAVMAGYLFEYLLKKCKNEDKKWIFQTDADIKNHQKFKALEYLSWGILKDPNSLHIKIAKGGRNNEAHMAVRSALVMLEDLDKVIEDEKVFKIAQRARQLFENLAKYKWILGGTFALYDELAFSRPFATGYLEETLITAFVEDFINKNGGISLQVANPNYCSDGDNSFIKENTIVQITANFVMTLALIEKPIYDWNLNDIAWINKNLMTKPKPIVLIPPRNDQRPVIVKMIANERILPSIKMLDENGLINWDKADLFFKRKKLL